jgi:hypothetical protein
VLSSAATSGLDRSVVSECTRAASHPDWQIGGLIPHPDGYLLINAVVQPVTDESFDAYLIVDDFEPSSL